MLPSPGQNYPLISLALSFHPMISFPLGKRMNWHFLMYCTANAVDLAFFFLQFSAHCPHKKWQRGTLAHVSVILITVSMELQHETDMLLSRVIVWMLHCDCCSSEIYRPATSQERNLDVSRCFDTTKRSHVRRLWAGELERPPRHSFSRRFFSFGRQGHRTCVQTQAILKLRIHACTWIPLAVIKMVFVQRQQRLLPSCWIGISRRSLLLCTSVPWCCDQNF